MATLGVTIAFIAPGEVHLALPFAARFCQQNGFMHAGAIASVADSANGYAAYTLAPPDTDVLAVEFKINLLAPARGEGVRRVRPGPACGPDPDRVPGRRIHRRRGRAHAHRHHALHRHRASDEGRPCWSERVRQVQLLDQVSPERLIKP